MSDKDIISLYINFTNVTICMYNSFHSCIYVPFNPLARNLVFLASSISSISITIVGGIPLSITPFLPACAGEQVVAYSILYINVT